MATQFAERLWFRLPETLFSATGLGIAQNGDIYVSNGTQHNTGVLQFDPMTAELKGHGSIQMQGTDENGDFWWRELFNTDMAFDNSGNGWMSSYYGLFPWDRNPISMSPYGPVPFSEGIFNEIQVVSATLATPEPSTALLVGMGLALTAVSRLRTTT